MLSTRQLLLALSLAAVGALAWWQQQGAELRGPGSGDKLGRPDYTVDNFTATVMDEAGKPHRRLSAVELRHYPGDDSNELESPELTLFEEAGPPWLVRSEVARLFQNNNLIFLHGEVYVDREEGNRMRALHLKTREMLLKRDEDYAVTDQPVRITSGSDWVTADHGAQIWLEEKLRIKLLGRVRGEMAIP